MAKVNALRLAYKVFLAGGYVFWGIILIYISLLVCSFVVEYSYDLPGGYTIAKHEWDSRSEIRDSNRKTVLTDVYSFGFCGHYVYGDYDGINGLSDFVIDTTSGRILKDSQKMDGIDFSKYNTEQFEVIDELRYHETKGIGWKKCY